MGDCEYQSDPTEARGPTKRLPRSEASEQEQ